MTQQRKHTPGPWFAVRNSAYWEVNPARNYGDEHIPYTVADCCPSDPADPDGGLQEANARLIAAAPDLLVAAKMADAVMSEMAARVGSQHAWWDIIFDIRAAIAKARGQS
jgi:hypothetical protein